MLTEGLRRAETRRRVIVDDGQAAEAVGVRGKGCCRGSPDFWSPRAGLASSWEARETISTAGGTPAVKNCGGGSISPAAASGSNPACSRAEAMASGLRDDPRLETVPLRWPLAVVTQWSGRSTAMQETQRGGASGRGARGSTALWGLGLGFMGVWVTLFLGRRGGLGVRAGHGGSLGFSGGRWREEGEGLTCGPSHQRQRGRGRAARAGEERSADKRALAGRERKRERRRAMLGLGRRAAGLTSLFLSPFLFFFKLTQFYLNSNEIGIQT
jgi:hypothetical protein